MFIPSWTRPPKGGLFSYTIPMIELTGKTLVTTDWHFGLKGNQIGRLKILVDITKKMSDFMKENKVENFLFCGDFFHNRESLSVNTINVALSCMDILSRGRKVVMILGNHDLFNKNSTKINSANIFRNTRNVTIVNEPTDAFLNDKKALFVPWLSDLSGYRKNTFDLMFGHFDVSPEYQMAAYIEDNSGRVQTTDRLMDIIENDDLLISSDMNVGFSSGNTDDTFLNRKKSSEMLGDWVDLVKPGGTIFSGHIHGRREFYAKRRKVVFIGSPYQQTLGESKSEDGFYLIDQSGKFEFHGIPGIPVHVDIRMSEVLSSGIESYDFSRCRGNIVHRVYDADVDRIDETKILQRISDNSPYEELPPDYELMFTTGSSDGKEVMESITAIKTSKMEYLHRYIDRMNDSDLSGHGIEKRKLLEIMNGYYEMAEDMQ